MEEVNIYKFYKNIETKDDFKKFLELLKLDYLNNPKSWENDRLDLFLEGLYGYNYNTTEKDTEPSWKKFAEMLLAAKVYE